MAFLLNLPNKGNFVNIETNEASKEKPMSTANLPQYICSYSTEPPVNQTIKNDSSNLLIRSLSKKKEKSTKETTQPVDTKKESKELKESKESKEKKKQVDLFSDDLKQTSKQTPPTATNKNTKRPAPMAPVKQKTATKRAKTAEKLSDRLNRV